MAKFLQKKRDNVFQGKNCGGLKLPFFAIYGPIAPPEATFSVFVSKSLPRTHKVALQSLDKASKTYGTIMAPSLGSRYATYLGKIKKTSEL